MLALVICTSAGCGGRSATAAAHPSPDADSATGAGSTGLSASGAAPLTFGVSASAVASRIGCTGGTEASPTADQMPAVAGPTPTSEVTCSFEGQDALVSAWPTRAEELAEEKAVGRVVTSPSQPGYLAVGSGWIVSPVGVDLTGSSGYELVSAVVSEVGGAIVQVR